MREVWVVALHLAVHLFSGERALAVSRKSADWTNAKAFFLPNDASENVGFVGEDEVAGINPLNSSSRTGSGILRPEGALQPPTERRTTSSSELPISAFSTAPEFFLALFPSSTSQRALDAESSTGGASGGGGEGLLEVQDLPSFVEGSPETIRFQKGALTPPVCRQAQCRRGGTLPFFDKSKKSCFSVTSCRDCPDHSAGLDTICQLHGRRKGFSLLIQNTLTPGAPPQLFRYRRATKEEVEKTIAKQTPLSKVRSAAGTTESTSASPAPEEGPEEEVAEEGPSSYGEEEEYEFIQIEKREEATLEDAAYPCGQFEESGKSTRNQSGPDVETAEPFRLHSNLSFNSDSPAAPSFLTVTAMPGFDSYEQDEAETMGEADQATFENQQGAATSASGRTARSGETAMFSLPSSALLSPPSDCLIDHKGYTRFQLSVLLASKDPRKPAPLVRDAYGPSSVFASGGTDSSFNEPTSERSQGGYEEDFDDFGENSGEASLVQLLDDEEGGDGKPGFVSKIGKFFKRGRGADAEEGGLQEEEESSGKKSGIFKRLFRRKSSGGGEKDEYGEEEEGDFEGPKGAPRQRKQKRSFKGILSTARSAGQKIKRGVTAPVKALKGPGIAARLKVQIIAAFSSPAASTCSRPATWTGLLKETSLLRVVFEVRVRNVEVAGAFLDFVRSSLALQVTCQQKNCRLEDSLLACAQVSCPKQRRLKAAVRERWQEHDAAVQQQLQQIATVLQHADTPEQLSMQDRIKIAKAYSEKMRQEQLHTQKEEADRHQRLKEHLQDAQAAMRAQEQKLLQQEAQRQLLQQHAESPEEDLISEEAGREVAEKRRTPFAMGSGATVMHSLNSLGIFTFATAITIYIVAFL